MTRTGGTGSVRIRLLAGAAVALAAGITGCTLFFSEQVFSPGNRAKSYIVDQSTGEIWACAAGGCQMNE